MTYQQLTKLHTLILRNHKADRKQLRIGIKYLSELSVVCIIIDSTRTYYRWTKSRWVETALY